MIDWSKRPQRADHERCERPAWLADFVLQLGRDEHERDPNGKMRVWTVPKIQKR